MFENRKAALDVRELDARRVRTDTDSTRSHGMRALRTLPYPQATYSKLVLFITCSEGAAALTITLNHAGGAAPKVTTLMLPDYGIGGAPANDAVFFNLIQGMHKWSSTNQEGDGPSHTITGIELAPSATDMLTSIKSRRRTVRMPYFGAQRASRRAP